MYPLQRLTLNCQIESRTIDTFYPYKGSRTKKRKYIHMYQHVYRSCKVNKMVNFYLTSIQTVSFVNNELFF